MNRMADVAAILDKKLEEDFFVKRLTEPGQPICKVWLCEKGLRELNAGGRYNDSILVDLLVGEAVIVDD